MKNKKLLILIPALMLTFGGLSTLVSCGPTGGDPGEQDVKVTSVTLNKTELSLEVGASETLTATIAPDNATNKGLTWTVAPEGVATVSALGKVTGSAAGECVVTATAKDGSGKSASCAVTVTAVDNHGKSETDPLTVAEALGKAKALADGAKTSDHYYISGKVKQITEVWTSTNGNMSFKMVDALTDEEAFVAYRVNCDETMAAKVKLESDVVVEGLIMNYVKNNEHTYETAWSKGSADNGSVVSATGGQADLPEPAHQTKTLAEIIDADASLAKKVAYETTAFVKYFGKAEGTAADKYGNATLTDNNGHEIYSYGMTAVATALTWSGAAGEYSFQNPQTFLTNETTAGLLAGAELRLLVIRSDHNGEKQLNTIITEVIANGTLPELESFTLGPANAQVKEGKTLTLTVTPNAGVTVALTDFSWTSSDPSVASVEDGVVTGVAHSVDPVTITATHKEKTSITNTLQVTCVEDSGGGDQQNVTVTFDTTTWATETQAVSGTTKFTSLALDENVTMTVSGTDSNTGKLYGPGNDTGLWEIRMYGSGNGTLTITLAANYEFVSASASIGKANWGAGVDEDLTISGNTATYSVTGSNKHNVKAVTIVYRAA